MGIKPKDDLSFEFVYKVMNYDCFTGEFHWSSNLSDLSHMGVRAGRFVGKPAGVKYQQSRTKYVKVMINGSVYKAHRLAWLMTYEKWPDGEIDHEDGDGTNNRIENLRDVSGSENSKNKRTFSNNTTGVSGVHFNKSTGKFIARISVSGKRIFLGSFDTLEEAIHVRNPALIEHGFHHLHGTVKDG